MQLYTIVREVLTKYRNIAMIFIVCGIGIGSLISWTYYRIGSSTRHSIYVLPQNCPANEIGIVFGCGKYVPGGRTNLYYLYRIQAAADLYKAGKLKHILASGDNHVVGYNEPETMKQDLIKEGVPETAITLDYAGFSTFETLIRAREVFGVQSATLITQTFHLPRALYIAEVQGMQVVGYAAKEPYQSLQTWKTELREVLARAATFGDLHIWNRKPKFLGKKEIIVIKE